MKFTRFILQAGQIVSSNEIDSRELDPPSLQNAVEILTRLRESDPGMTHPIPDAPSASIGLGGPTDLPWEEIDETLAELGMTRVEWNEEEQKARNGEFYVLQDERSVPFSIVPSSTITDDPSLFGTIAGSFAGYQVQLPEEQRDARPIEEQIAEHKAVAARIWADRPALVSPSDVDDSIAAFTDRLAAALLLDAESDLSNTSPVR